jgi:TonB family protein
LIQSSGFPELDAAALHAILEAAPFPPAPHDLAPHLPRLSITMPIEFANPMFQ